jgi:hypothetical protein
LDTGVEIVNTPVETNMIFASFAPLQLSVADIVAQVNKMNQSSTCTAIVKLGGAYDHKGHTMRFVFHHQNSHPPSISALMARLQQAIRDCQACESG